VEVFYDLDLIHNFFVPISYSHISGLRKPNKDIRPSIVETEAEANIEGTLKKTNIFSGSPSFPPPSDKSYQFSL
jgi:hypothetical protein